MLSGVLVVVAVVLAVLPMPPPLVERYYSDAAYPALQRVLTPLSNRVSFALFDVLMGVVAAWLVVSVWSSLAGARRGRVWRAVIRLVRLSVVTAAAVYVAFLAAWGLNYRRIPLGDKLTFDSSKATPARARQLADMSVERLNALHDAAHAGFNVGDGVDTALRQSFARTVRELGVSWRVTIARPKGSLIDPYLRAAGVDGMTDPFFLETLVASGPLPIERPFVVAHEWSHLAGFAHEGEANFAGWLTAVRGGLAAQYSAWLFLYSELVRSLDRDARDQVGRQLAAGPRADLRAIALRYQQQVRPMVSSAGWQAYDRYLKANRIESGAASYGEVVHLLLGTRFGADWTPVRRDR